MKLDMKKADHPSRYGARQEHGHVHLRLQRTGGSELPYVVVDKHIADWLILKFIQLQFAVAVAVQLLESFRKRRDVAPFGVADEFFESDRSVIVPVAAPEKLVSGRTIRHWGLR